MKVVVAAGATAAAKIPGLDGMLAALINFTMLANDVRTTTSAIENNGRCGNMTGRS